MCKQQVYTDYEMACRIWHVEEIKHVMSRRSYYYANDMRREELNDLWVTSPEYRETASFGRNWGYYVGMDAISNYYVVSHYEQRKAELAAYHAADPSVSLSEENLGYGSGQMHPVNTPVVEIAGDGKTARGLWYSVGHDTIGRPGGNSDALWQSEVIGADFVLEGDQWKIWHLVIATDFSLQAGEAFDEQPVYPEPGTDPIENEFGTPTIPMLTHDMTFMYEDDYPSWPRPYFTFSMKNSYAPQGHPKYKEGL